RATSAGAWSCLVRAPARGIILALVVGSVCLLGCIRLTRSAAAQPAPPETPAQERPKTENASPPPKAVVTHPSGREPAKEPSKDEPPPPRRGTRPSPFELLDRRRVVQSFGVTTVKPQREAWAKLTSAYCMLHVMNPSPIHTRVAGIVLAEGLAAVGDRVKKGDMLAEIEATDLPTQTGKARATLRQATAKRKQAQAAVAIAKSAV